MAFPYKQWVQNHSKIYDYYSENRIISGIKINEVVDQSLNATHLTTVLVHMQSVTLYIYITNFNLSCNLATLDYIILFYI